MLCQETKPFPRALGMFKGREAWWLSSRLERSSVRRYIRDRSPGARLPHTKIKTMTAVMHTPTTSTPHSPSPMLSCNTTVSAFDLPSCKACVEAKFAFARVKGDVCLVQGMSLSHSRNLKDRGIDLESCFTVALTDCTSGLTPIDVNIFRHEFITIFRWSHQTTLHPDDICILEPIDERCIRYEEENGTVFMAKDVMEKLRRGISERRAPIQRRKPSRWSRPSQ